MIYMLSIFLVFVFALAVLTQALIAIVEPFYLHYRRKRLATKAEEEKRS